MRNQERALVIAAGPSVWLNIDQAPDFDGIIIAVDRMTIPCIQKGIIPDYIVSIEEGVESIIPDLFPKEILEPYKHKIHFIYTFRTRRWIVNHIELMGIPAEQWNSMRKEYVSNVGLQGVRFAVEKLKVKEVVLIGFNHTEKYMQYIDDFMRCIEDFPEVEYINCTGAGNLYSEPIIRGKLEDYLEMRKVPARIQK
jgi:hypothetical protein